MKTLILSCNTGEGHNSAAKAIKYHFDQAGMTCDMTDALAFWSPEISKLVCSGHVFLYRKLPDVFDIVYRGAEALEKNKPESVDSAIFVLLAMGAKKLYEFILSEGYDRIICVHPFASQMLTKVMRKHPELSARTFLVATDYTCSPGVAESRMDRYLIPHTDLTEEFVSHGIPRERVCVCGIPISPVFDAPLTKEEARQRLSLPADAKAVLLMCGSMGCGPIETVAEQISRRMDGNTVLTVICGKNEKLYKSLFPLSEENSRTRVLGYSEEVPLYMMASDLFMTKPGGLSSTEAACLRLPMVMLDAVAGCETYNLDFFVSRGMARGAENAEDAVEKVLSALKDETFLSRAKDSMRAGFPGENAYRIFRQVQEMPDMEIPADD